MYRKKLGKACPVALAALLVAGLATMGQAADGTVVTGEADGFGGKITAEVTLDENNQIVDLTLTGADETPEIGGAALETLKEAILANGSVDGVDAVSGASVTSAGVFDAVNNAINGGGEAASDETEAGETEAAETEAGETDAAKEEGAANDVAGPSHGLAFSSSGRVGPGADDTGVGIYSLNEIIAYVVFDADGRIMDLEVDQLEVGTANYSGEHMPNLTGLPGQSYSTDADHDGKADGEVEQTDDNYVAEVASWITKRQRGDTYQLNSATWTEEMDQFEETFKGMTIDELKDWYATYCSDVNGRPLHGTSEDEKDIAKYDALTDDQKAEMDAISTATMSLNDAHGNIIGAIEKAYENRQALEGATEIAKIGLAIENEGAPGHGADDQGVSTYTFDTLATGTCFDSEGKIVGVYSDIMEVSSPNTSNEFVPKFTGFPGQSFNTDEDFDGKIDTAAEQTDDTFLEQVASWTTKRERGDTYQMPSGTWADEMDIFQNRFRGMTTDELNEWYATYCSETSGKILFAETGVEEDDAKFAAFTDDQKAELDAVTGASMSLGNQESGILSSILKSWDNAKDTSITF